MRILIIDTYYPLFLSNFYKKYSNVLGYTYTKHKQKVMNEMFGTADFYSKSLEKLGHPAEGIILNNEHLQKRWALENHVSINNSQNFTDNIIRLIPFVKNRISQNWELKILNAQIKKFKPDIIYSHNIGYIDPNFLFDIKSKVKLIVGQIACPIPFLRNFKPYDLIITSFPHFIDKFKEMGISAEYLQLCFEPFVLKKIPKQKRTYDATFIGGISRVHKKGFKLLNQLTERTKIDIWGYGKEELDPKSKLYQYHHGEAWGRDMYKLMLQSKITINRHIDVAENYANNMRLYEATGCGAMLITDKKDNLGSIFQVGKEVVSYTNVDDLVDKIKYYLRYDKEREKIAKAGQKRTLADYTYEVRMKQLLEIIQKYL